MKLRFVFVAVLIISLLCIGSVSANDLPVTKVVGSIQAPANSVVITPPAANTPWNLSFDKPNEITLGDIHIVANCNYTLAVQGSTGGYMIGEEGSAMSFPTLKSPVYVWTGTGWAPTQASGRTSLTIYTGHPGTVDVPLKLRQELSPEDAGIISPTIMLWYVVTIT